MVMQAVVYCFIVVLVLLLVLLYGGSRSSLLGDFRLFKTYDDAYAYAHQALSSDCLVADQCSGGKCRGIYGVISVEKIGRMGKGYDELPCENILPVYRLRFRDSKSGKVWEIGPKAELDSEQLRVSYPVSLQYGDFEVSRGTAEMTVYDGWLSDLKAAIARVCQTRENLTVRVAGVPAVEYEARTNRYSSGAFVMRPLFGCPVSDFRISGDTLVVLLWDGKKLQVRQ